MRLSLRPTYTTHIQYPESLPCDTLPLFLARTRCLPPEVRGQCDVGCGLEAHHNIYPSQLGWSGFGSTLIATDQTIIDIRLAAPSRHGHLFIDCLGPTNPSATEEVFAFTSVLRQNAAAGFTSHPASVLNINQSAIGRRYTLHVIENRRKVFRNRS